jgi:DNA-binding GntR family transcriptional regulator
MEIHRVTRTNHQFVREAVRHAILSGEYPPGTRLVQADLARQLDVSTTPVREALRDLAADGLVRLDAYRGAIIQPLDADEIEEIYQMLKVLEPLSLERAVRFITEPELDEAERILTRMLEGDGSAEFVALDRQFHGVLAKAARAPRLQATIDSLRDSAARYIAASYRESTEMVAHANGDHRALLTAMRQRDREAAQLVESAHLSWARTRWMDSVRETQKAAEQQAPMRQSWV